jgi:RNA polymerase sigma-70 factor (ECF subfamily)
MDRNPPEPEAYKKGEMAAAVASAPAPQAASGPVLSDEQLVVEVLRGRHAAFAELASRHRARVERLCRRFFADPEVVRDLSQDAFIKAFTGLPGYRLEESFAGWLRAIVVNVCYDELRRRHRHPEESVADFSSPAVANWVQLVNTATPEEIVEAAETRREAHDLAHQLLATLRPEDRLVLVLRESEEMSVAEIAKLVGWSTAKVKIRAFRARQTMRKQAERILAARSYRSINELL